MSHILPDATTQTQRHVCKRLHIEVGGAVQGVGFRPFVYGLATRLHLTGCVSNSSHGAVIEVEGDSADIDRFLVLLHAELPVNAQIADLDAAWIEPRSDTSFSIQTSTATGAVEALVLPDLAVCQHCLAEMHNPSDRRYRYPFTNCTHCGPRFSIIDAVPYDRHNTTMRGFLMCPECRAEYENPADRRFHAQPIACPKCGPHVDLLGFDGSLMASRDDAIARCIDIVRDGGILALKGIGGYQLICDARNEEAVSRLRAGKRRDAKPLAIMVPSSEFAALLCEVSPAERALLESPAAPIVLLTRRDRDHAVAAAVAPANPWLGLMLPYSPLHHLLMSGLGAPVVATSGNLSEEPICTENEEALTRLRGMADVFLVHDRPICRAVDDSVVRVFRGRPYILRAARGYAPLPVHFATNGRSVLSVGAHQKCTVAVTAGASVCLGQHIGDLDNVRSLDAHARSVESLTSLFQATPSVVACDLHPDYATTQYALTLDLPVVRVQHHAAHVTACMAEHDLSGPVLGVSWDGTGYGTDGTIWGSEFLVSTLDRSERVAHLRTFPLPGGDHAAREPWRSAAGVLYALWGEHALNPEGQLPSFRNRTSTDLAIVKDMLQKRVNTPVTSSAGRLFDAVASLLGLRQRCSFEGQAAMMLEWAAMKSSIRGAYPMRLRFDDDRLILDWGDVIANVVKDVHGVRPLEDIAALFHHSLVQAIVDVAELVQLDHVVLTGGCFQNMYLLERTVAELERHDFHPYWHQRVPTNDGGIALGQAARVLAQGAIKKESFPCV